MIQMEIRTNEEDITSVKISTETSRGYTKHAVIDFISPDGVEEYVFRMQKFDDDDITEYNTWKMLGTQPNIQALVGRAIASSRYFFQWFSNRIRNSLNLIGDSAEIHEAAEQIFNSDEMQQLEEMVWEHVKTWWKVRYCNDFGVVDECPGEPFCIHELCDRCGDEEVEIHQVELYENCDHFMESMNVCLRCLDLIEMDYQTCTYSSDRLVRGNTIHDGGYTMCTHHAASYYGTCDSCNRLLNEGECTECITIIHEWDYTPALIFHPMPPKSTTPFYIGMEMEVSFRPTYDPATEVVEWHKKWEEVMEDLVYIKTDSSITNGLEFVTHPMNPQWAYQNFPFKAFDELVEKHNAQTAERSCGTHIHINKEAFSSSHLWKFVQLHYRIPRFLQMLGGREEVEFAKWKGSGIAAQRNVLKDLAQKKGNTDWQIDRYVAVNLRPEYTIEMRYPAAGTTGKSIRKNMELADALFHFTGELKVRDIQQGIADDPGYLLGWLRNQKKQFPELNNHILRTIPEPKEWRKN